MLRSIACFTLAILYLALPAEARSCKEVQTAISEVTAAATKQAVADILKRLGAPAETADNLARASPDVDVARSNALRTLRSMESSCTQ